MIPPRKKSGRRGAPCEPFHQQPAEVGEGELDRRCPLADGRAVRDVGDDLAQPVELPLLRRLDREQALTHVEERRAPLRRGTGALHVVGDRREVREHVGEPPGDRDVAAFDPERRDLAGGERPVVLADRDAHEEPVERGPPGVRGVGGGDTPGLAVLAVESPAHVGLGDPMADDRDRLVVEIEPGADGREREELEDRRRGEAAGDEPEQRVERGEQRIRLAERPVGDPVREARPAQRFGTGPRRRPTSRSPTPPTARTPRSPG